MNIALALENPGKLIYFNYMELTWLTTLHLTVGRIMVLDKMLSFSETDLLEGAMSPLLLILKFRK